MPTNPLDLSFPQPPLQTFNKCTLRPLLSDEVLHHAWSIQGPRWHRSTVNFDTWLPRLPWASVPQGQPEEEKYWRSAQEALKGKVAQLCLTLCDPVDYTVHGILQARILEWVAFPFSRGSSQHRDRTQVSHSAGRFFTSWATRGALWIRSAAAKSCQLCPTLCGPIDGSPPGSTIPGILQARTLEWVAIYFSSAWKVKSESEVSQSCLTLRNPMDCSLPGSSVHEISQARVVEWGDIAFSHELGLEKVKSL